MNAVKDNSTTEAIEKLDKLCQVLEHKKGHAMEIGEYQDTPMEQLEALQQNFNEYISKSDKGDKISEVLQKDLN